MWEPRPLTTLWAFMACYRGSFTFCVCTLDIVILGNFKVFQGARVHNMACWLWFFSVLLLVYLCCLPPVVLYTVCAFRYSSCMLHFISDLRDRQLERILLSFSCRDMCMQGSCQRVLSELDVESDFGIVLCYNTSFMLYNLSWEVDSHVAG
jgi:hypothetical protein